MTKPVPFRPSRTDGRSDVQVVLDLVHGQRPGHLFTFDELVAALSKHTDRTIDVTTATAAVGRAYARLLKEQSRTLQSVAGIGYRIATADAHQTLAHGRKRRADRQLQNGVMVLNHVKWDEMDETARAAHVGTLMVMSALYESQRALERRQDRTEAAIRKIMQERTISTTSAAEDAA